MSAPREQPPSAAQLRQDFDDSFTRAPAGIRPPELDLLLLEAGGLHYAVRLSQVSAVHAEHHVVPVPSPDPLLRGLVGLRGSVLPVYDLAAALGHTRGSTARGLLELRSPKPCALAFGTLEGHLRLPSTAVAPRTHAPENQPAASATVPTGDGPLPLIDLLTIYEELIGRSF